MDLGLIQADPGREVFLGVSAGLAEPGLAGVVTHSNETLLQT